MGGVLMAGIFAPPQGFIAMPLPHKSTHASGGSDPLAPADIGAIANAGGTPSIMAGTQASRPAAGVVGRIFIATDTQRIYRDTGSAWVLVGAVGKIVAISSGSGLNISTTASVASPADTDLSVSFNADGISRYLAFAVLQVGVATNANGGLAIGGAGISLDGVSPGRDASYVGFTGPANSTVGYGNHKWLLDLGVLPAGSHTLKVVWWVEANAANQFSNVGYHRRLIVTQIPN